MPKNKYIETPEKMWDYFLAYKQWAKSNPIKKHVFVGKDGNSDFELRERPLTTEGFECYMFDLGIIADLGHYFANTDGRYEEYRTICHAIKKEIRNDQIQGGMAGIYNPSITQRLNGLVEKSETTIKAEQPLFGDD